MNALPEWYDKNRRAEIRNFQRDLRAQIKALQSEVKDLEERLASAVALASALAQSRRELMNEHRIEHRLARGPDWTISPPSAKQSRKGVSAPEAARLRPIMQYDDPT